MTQQLPKEFIITKNFDNQAKIEDHRLVIKLTDKNKGLSGYIAFHRGGFINPAFGATRIWTYKSQTEMIEDALRLSKIMSYKSAISGFKYGGAKAVLLNPAHFSSRRDFLQTYAKYINLLNGHFITGADVGVDQTDLKMLRAYSPFIVGLKSDPVKYTALGVLYGIEECLKLLFGTKDLSKRTFAIQGLGKTGLSLLKLIYQKTDKIYASDINEKIIRYVAEKFKRVKIVSSHEIIRLKVDVFAPCALGNAINSKNFSGLRCKIIAGSANNQLESPIVGDILHKLGIFYAPDYVINAGGLMAVVDEYKHGSSTEKRMKKKLNIIKRNLRLIFETSQKQNQPSYLVANKIAEERFNKFI